MHLRHMPPSNCNLINSNCSRSFLNNSWLLRPSNVMSSALPGALPNALHIFAIRYTTFPLTWPARGLGHQHGNRFVVLFCLGTPIWRKFWKRFLAKALSTWKRPSVRHDSIVLHIQHNYFTKHEKWKFPMAVFCKVQDASFQWRILGKWIG